MLRQVSGAGNKRAMNKALGRFRYGNAWQWEPGDPSDFELVFEREDRATFVARLAASQMEQAVLSIPSMLLIKRFGSPERAARFVDEFRIALGLAQAGDTLPDGTPPDAARIKP